MITRYGRPERTPTYAFARRRSTCNNNNNNNNNINNNNNNNNNVINNNNNNNTLCIFYDIVREILSSQRHRTLRACGLMRYVVRRRLGLGSEWRGVPCPPLAAGSGPITSDRLRPSVRRVAPAAATRRTETTVASP